MRWVGERAEINLSRAPEGCRLKIGFVGTVSRQWVRELNAMLGVLAATADDEPLPGPSSLPGGESLPA